MDGAIRFVFSFLFFGPAGGRTGGHVLSFWDLTVAAASASTFKPLNCQQKPIQVPIMAHEVIWLLTWYTLKMCPNFLIVRQSHDLFGPLILEQYLHFIRYRILSWNNTESGFPILFISLLFFINLTMENYSSWTYTFENRFVQFYSWNKYLLFIPFAKAKEAEWEPKQNIHI